MKIYTDLDLRGNKLINAELEDPSFDGDVTVPTRPVGDNSTKVANTAFVHNEIIANIDDELSTESEKAVQNKVVTENLEKKVDTDKIYPDLTAGTALQLLGNTYTEDKTPYNFRKSGGSVKVGTREKDKIVGGTIAWNSYISLTTGTSTTGNGHITVTRDDTTGKVTVTSDGENSASDGVNIIQATQFGIPCIGGHKILVDLQATRNVTGLTQKLYCSSTPNWTGSSPIIENKSLTTRGVYALPSDAIRLTWYLYSAANKTYDEVFYPQIYDLTQMFGSTIADFLYTLEQANAGAGIAWFRNLFPKNHYAYNVGELMSVKTSAHNMTGFNQLDLANDYASNNVSYNNGTISNIVADSISTFRLFIQLVQGTTSVANIDFITSTTGGRSTHTFNIPTGVDYTAIRFKHNGASRDIHLFSLPKERVIDGANYCLSYELIGTNPSVVGGLKLSNVNVNLSWDGSRNGEYEPYELHSYPLDPDLELRGIPKLDANNALYYDGDIYEAGGKVTRKYGIIDLGTWNWVKRDELSGLFWVNVTGIMKYHGNAATNKYANLDEIFSAISDKSMSTNPSNFSSTTSALFIRDTAYSDATSFRAAMSGVYLVYELATPTTETADPFAEIQIVSEYGTEEYVDERAVAIPVGHDTQYPTDLVAKIEEIPGPPTADGTYTLKAVVSGGVATYSWG